MRSRCRRLGEALYAGWNRFEVFRRDMGPKPNGAVLRRRDASQPWGPGNACWARWDPKTQTAVLPDEDKNESNEPEER